MEPCKGYYSLVQFCPDRGRAEAVNIGLVLFVPAIELLQVRTISSTKRISHVFGRGAVDSWWLKTARASFETALTKEHEAGRFGNAEDLDQYLASLGNDIVPTPTRPTRIEDPVADMKRLFSRLVRSVPDSNAKPIPDVALPLEQAFRRLSVRLQNVEFDQKFSIPEFHHDVQADYMFMNECANLVRLLRIDSSPANVINKAVKLGGESVLVDKHLRIHDERAKLVIVGAPLSPGAETRQTEDRLSSLYRELYPKAEWIASTNIPDFVKHVESEAR